MSFTWHVYWQVSSRRVWKKRNVCQMRICFVHYTQLECYWLMLTSLSEMITTVKCWQHYTDRLLRYLCSSGWEKQACLCLCVPNNPWWPVALGSTLMCLLTILLRTFWNTPTNTFLVFHDTQGLQGFWAGKHPSQHANWNRDDTLMSTQAHAQFVCADNRSRLTSCDCFMNSHLRQRFVNR